MANFLLSQFARKEENLNTPQQHPKDEWLSLLRKLQTKRGNAVLAILEAKRQRPDLWANWNGKTPAPEQMELFVTGGPPAAKSDLNGCESEDRQ